MAETIEEVIEALDRVVRKATEDHDPVGYFAVLYRRVTAAVRDALDAGEFMDGPRMDRLDVVFGNRYLDALEAYRIGGPVTESWRVAFDACRLREPTILQHLYAGLAAHLLLDLGLGAAETSPGGRIFDLRGDFDHVNEIVGRLMRDVDRRVGELSPWVGRFERFAGVPYARANRVSIYVARQVAWRWALELAPLGESERTRRVEARDALTARVTRLITRPPGPAGLVARLVRERESDDVAHNIRVLGR